MDQIAKIARLAASTTTGVAQLVGPLDVIVIPTNINLDVYDVDIYLIIRYGFKIPDIAWDVQENVKRLLEKNHITNVEHINIHIQGVSFSEE